jgi:hypothetical protein
VRLLGRPECARARAHTHRRIFWYGSTKKKKWKADVFQCYTEYAIIHGVTESRDESPFWVTYDSGPDLCERITTLALRMVDEMEQRAKASPILMRSCLDNTISPLCALAKHTGWSVLAPLM